ncbi:hypothetical protein DASC09_040750 [Saccharomycopsis crataegensis]|uniref:Major facilitator superfamily (MFS) profile domain-containing protein n=1 Tax=Saccharomycopsis crataegensis TaxID=43959 RepID=A0AAV5QQE2_9ASCO|nr:hypothetical protein DASC09_040750 [Saccharomycopsis crataegensis]
MFWVVGSLVSVTVVNVLMICVGRAFKGVSVGIFAAHLPVYVSDVIPAHKKEAILSAVQWCLTWGICVMFLLGFACLKLGGTISFRVAWAIEAIPGLLVLFCAGWLPESPKWLITRKRWKEAHNILNNLQHREPITREGMHSNEDTNEIGGDVEKAIDAYQAAFKDGKNCDFSELFKAPLLNHTLTGLFVQVMVQLTAINVLMYFLVYICEMIGLQGNRKIVATSLQYVINIIFTIFPMVLLSKLRRKDVIVFGISTLGLCLVSISSVMGWFGHKITPMNGNTSIQWEIQGAPGSVVLALCYLFVAIFASTVACASWIYTEEIFPRRAKPKGSAICISTSWFVSTLLTFVGPLFLQYFKWATFMIFGVICIISSVIMIMIFPETYKKTDIEIENLYIPHSTIDGRFVVGGDDEEEEEEEEEGEEGEEEQEKEGKNNPGMRNEIFSSGKTQGRSYTLLSKGLMFGGTSGNSELCQVSPFLRKSGSGSIFGGPINIVDSLSSQISPFDAIEDCNSPFKTNVSGRIY